MDTLNELRDFYDQISKFEDLVKEWKNSPEQQKEIEKERSRTELQRLYPKLEKKISHYGEYKPVGALIGMKLDVFEISFDSINKSSAIGKLNAINEAKNILNKAIGKLEVEGETWYAITDKGKRTNVKKSKKSTYQRIWKWIDTHRILSILGALAAIATIISVLLSFIR